MGVCVSGGDSKVGESATRWKNSEEEGCLEDLQGGNVLEEE